MGAVIDLMRSTAEDDGLAASVRTGHLKKDLSLLFENDNAELPDLYQFNSGDTQEPSIRPMSSELLAQSSQRRQWFTPDKLQSSLPGSFIEFGSRIESISACGHREHLAPQRRIRSGHSLAS